MKTLYVLLFALFGLAELSFGQQNIQLTLRYNQANSVYEVLGKANFSGTFAWGPGQISVVLPKRGSASQTSAQPLSITSVSAGSWNDNSRAYGPTADPTHEFHGIGSGGSAVTLVAGQEFTVFTFTLSEGCLAGVRLFNNGTDPDSNAPGMAGGDYANYIPNGQTVLDFYGGNYSNTGTTCGTNPPVVAGKFDLELTFDQQTCTYEVRAIPDFTGKFAWGSAQVSLVLPAGLAGIANTALSVTSVSPMTWADQSRLNAPTASSTHDFHSISTSGAALTVTSGVAIPLFRFKLPGCCVDGIRLFQDGVDPQASAAGMGGNDFANSITSGTDTQEHYDANINPSGISCVVPPTTGNFQLTLVFDKASCVYEVRTKPDFSGAFTWGPGQVSIVLPKSLSGVAGQPLAVTSVSIGSWADNSRLNAPTADPAHDFHGVASNGAAITVTTGVEIVLFRFKLPGCCVDGVRLFNNNVDPQSGTGPGTINEDFNNTIPEGTTTVDRYTGNYGLNVNTGISCDCGPVKCVPIIVSRL